MRVPECRHVTSSGRTLHIRSARANEAGRVFDHAWLIHKNTLDFTTDDMRRLLSRLGAAPDGFFLVADADGLVGTLSVAGGAVGLSVHPAWRRRGVGRALVSAAIAAAGESTLERLRLRVASGNLAARALYAACGFVVSNADENPLLMSYEL